MITRAGRWVLGSSVLVAAVGWQADTPELTFIGYVGIVIIALAGLWMLLTPDLLAVRDIEPARVAEGDTARGVLLVRNVGARRSPPILAIERVGNGSVTIPVPGLRVGETHETSYPLPTSTRGVFPVGPFSIGHSDPFRLMTSTHTYPSSAVLTVHPRVLEVSPLPTGVNRDMEGPTSSNSPRGGIAFHSIRPYEWGDPFRDVHWKKSAQTGQLLVSHKVVPDEPNMLLVLDTRSASYAGQDFEEAARVAASLCMAASRGGYPLQLRTTIGDVAISESGQDASASMLDLLAAARTQAEDPGLMSLAGMPPGRAATSLGVVTGRPGPEELAVVSSVRPGFLMATLIQVGGPGNQQRAELRGVFTVSCPDTETFAGQWNSNVAR